MKLLKDRKLDARVRRRNQVADSLLEPDLLAVAACCNGPKRLELAEVFERWAQQLRKAVEVMYLDKIGRKDVPPWPYNPLKAVRN